MVLASLDKPFLVNFQLLNSLLFPDYPSGSSINFYKEKFYLIGDDANELLVLDKAYQSVKSFSLFSFPEKRIPKTVKTDLEASAFITLANQDYLLLAGSASREIRERVLVIPFSDQDLDIEQLQTVNVSSFVHRLIANGIAEINLEGMTVMNDQLLLSNRGNQTNPVNHIIATQPDFWKHQSESTVKLIPVDYAQHTNEVLSVSELCYEPATDTLLITFSTEATANAYDDGVIGNSYLGYVHNASQKFHESILTLDGMINLPEQDSEFIGEKIEGVCVEQVRGKEIILHLISDNDLGSSRLFKCALAL